MKRELQLIVMLFIGLVCVSAVAIHAAATAQYWRNQYDAAKVQCFKEK